jgi:ABC-type branched-subunit amino acid transport system permease subunit
MLPAGMEQTAVRQGYELWRPNREKAETKTMKAIIAFVLLVSAALLIIVTLGGWKRLEGPSVGVMSLIWAGLYILFAFLVFRWNRGVLPVAAALAVILAIFAAISAPDWFARDKPGLSSPALPEDLLGLLTLILVPVQLILVAVALIGFNQEWHVEEERPVGGGPMHGETGSAPSPPPAPAAA